MKHISKWRLGSIFHNHRKTQFRQNVSYDLVAFTWRHDFVPRWPNQSCVSLLSSSSIYYWLAFNVCKSDTRGSRLKVPFCCNASLNMNKRINLEVIKDTTITLPSKILAMQIITRVFKLTTEKAPLYSDRHFVDSMGNHRQCGAENWAKNVLFRTCIAIHEETKWVLVIGDRSATYRMDYSLEILANIKKIHIWVIAGAFESPIVKRGQLQITRSNQVKERFNIGMYFFALKGWFQL